MTDALQILDYFGVFVFAVSGALVATRKEMDVFGMFVLALMPAVGGGTVRDLLLDVPVFWTQNNIYLALTLLAVVTTWFGQRYIHRLGRALALADAVGLSVFCVLGAAKALSVGASYAVALVMGVTTAVVGGLIRDVIANEIPYILQREIYATAALVGAGCFLALNAAGLGLAVWIGIAAALVARCLGILRGWSLPVQRRDNSSHV